MDTKNNEFYLDPNTVDGRQLIGKTAIGLLVGVMISFLLFLLLSFLAPIFTGVMQASDFVPNSPLLPLFMLLIGFLITLVGNTVVAGIYNLFWSYIYYDAWKIIALILLTNGLLFLIFAPIYIVFFNQTETLFLILGFHIMFSVFVSSNQIEFFANINYASSSLIGNTIGFAVSLLAYALVYRLLAGQSITALQETIYIMMILPPILGFTSIPFCLGVRQKIYYKFYEMGSNGFYVRSLSEVVLENDNVEDDSNVEL